MVHYDRVWQFDQIPTGTGAVSLEGPQLVLIQ